MVEGLTKYCSRYVHNAVLDKRVSGFDRGGQLIQSYNDFTFQFWKSEEKDQKGNVILGQCFCYRRNKIFSVF